MTPVQVVGRTPDLGSGAVNVKARTVSIDEGPRADTSLEGLARLKPVFAAKGSVTAGNSSQTSDGAGALILASEKAVKQFGLTPLARFVSFAARGVAPEIMGIGPIEAIPAALRYAGLSLADIGWIELNEAFAAQSLAVINTLIELFNAHQSEGLAVIAVAMDDEDARGDIEEFLTEHHATFDSVRSFDGASDEAFKAFEIPGESLPCLRLYARDGKVLRTFAIDPEADKQFTDDDVATAVIEALKK